MAYVIAEPCIDVLDISCVSVCPVDCIHYEEGVDRKLFIDPNECIDCGACEPECPVNAIFPEESLPPEWANYTQIDAQWFTDRAGRPRADPGAASPPDASAPPGPAPRAGPGGQPSVDWSRAHRLAPALRDRDRDRPRARRRAAGSATASRDPRPPRRPRRHAPGPQRPGERIDGDALATAAPDLVLVGDGSDGSIDARQLDAALGDLTPSVLTLAPAIGGGRVQRDRRGRRDDRVRGRGARGRRGPAGAAQGPARRSSSGAGTTGCGRPGSWCSTPVDPPRAAGRWVPDQVRLAGGWELLGQAGEPARRPRGTRWARWTRRCSSCSPAGCRLRTALAAWDGVARPAGLGRPPGGPRGPGVHRRRRRVRAGRARGSSTGSRSSPSSWIPAAFDGMAPPDTWVRAD